MRNFILRNIIVFIVFCLYELITFLFFPILSTFRHGIISIQFLIQLIACISLSNQIDKLFGLND
jgi:hypothetical protein